MKKFARILATVISFVFLGSCFENPDCIGLRNNLVNISFHKLFDGAADTLGVLQSSISGSDSVFYRQTGASLLTFPLNVNMNQQTINLNTTQGNFTVELSYQSKAQFEDVDCGPRFILSDLGVVKHSFDSLRLINSSPSSESRPVHLQVYRCPITDLVKIGFRQLLTNDDANGSALTQTLNGVSVDFLPFIFYADTELTSVVLPVNLAGNSTQVAINSAESGFQSLTLTYNVINQELFQVCGAQNFVNDIQVTGSSGFDIVRVQKDSLTDPPTTNVLLLKCPKTNQIELRLKSAPESNDTQFKINKITASYTSEEFYVDQTTAQLILPLDISQDQTDFVIEFESGTKQISFIYTRSQQVFHEQCNQTVISSVQVLSSDFTTAPILKESSIQFPTVVNFEIVND